jgi:hypothetical protein
MTEEEEQKEKFLEFDKNADGYDTIPSIDDQESNRLSSSEVTNSCLQSSFVEKHFR